MENLDIAKHICHCIQSIKWKENPLWTRLLTPSSGAIWYFSYIEWSFHPVAEFQITDTDGGRYWISLTAEGFLSAGIITEGYEKTFSMKTQRTPMYVSQTSSLRPFVHEELRKAGFNHV